VTRPVLELKAFARVAAGPGQRVAVRFDLPTGQLGFYGRDLRYTVETGQIEVYVGFSVDTRSLAGTFVVTGDAGQPEVRKVYTGTATLREL